MKLRLCSFLYFLSFAASSLAELKVVYPNINGVGKDLFGYSALYLALSESGKEFQLDVTEEPVNDARARLMVQQKLVSITDFGTSEEFEEQLRAIYFPIDLGLNGWRIFTVRDKAISDFNEINSIIDLTQKKAGQGIGWSDTRVLEDAGLEVFTAPFLKNLYEMLKAERFDFLPLSANATYRLYELHRGKELGLAVEPNILLVYPFGRLFFVHKDNADLHDAVMQGLTKAFDSGKYFDLFKSHPSNYGLFERANLKQRKRIDIENPHLSQRFKDIPPKYFFTVDLLDSSKSQ